MKPFTTFEDLRQDLDEVIKSFPCLPDGRLLSNTSARAGEFFDLIYIVLYALALQPEQAPKWLRERIAGELAPMLLQVRAAFMSGQFEHLEDVFGWKRPKGHRDTLTERQRLQMPIYIAVGRKLENGTAQAQAFDEIAEQFGKSKTFVEKIYREEEGKWHMTAMTKKSSKKKSNSRK